MAFKLFREAYERRRAEIEEHICDEVKAMRLQKKPITQAQLDEYFKSHGMNSYERDAVFPLLDDEALCNEVEACLKNVTMYREKGLDLCDTYEEALIRVFVPLLLKRLKEKKCARSSL